jgi:hypothetical protein
MELHLEPAELELVRDLLDSAFRDLRYEVAQTDRSSFKDQLREREELLRVVLEKLGGPLPDAPPASA